MIVSRSEGLAFVHVPKTAGSTVSRVLWRVWGDAEAVGAKHDGVRSRLWRELSDEVQTFAVVRNPWNRCLSWYGMIVRNHGAASSASASTVFHQLTSWVGERADSFDAYVHLLESPTEGEPRAMQLLRRTQHHLTHGPRGGQQVDFLCRFESLENDLSLVLRRPLRKPIGQGGLGEALREQHNASGLAPASEFYTPDLVERVGTLFAIDIETFGYDEAQPK